MREAPSACAEWDRLAQLREPVLRRAVANAKYTVPSLILEPGADPKADLYQPWQGLGARGTHNLASKLVMSLHPSTQSFVELRVSEADRELLGDVPGAATEVTIKLGRIADEIDTELEANGIREIAFEQFIHLIVCGNVLRHLGKEGKIELFPLDRYVVERAPDDTLTTLVIKEQVAKSVLDPDIRLLVSSEDALMDRPSSEDFVDVYTYFRRERKGSKFVYMGHQEINKVVIPKTQAQYSEKTFPYQALRWQRVTRSAWGRAHVESLFGDLISYENLSKALVEGAAAAARLIILRRPNAAGSTIQQLARTKNGEFAVGNQEDYAYLRTEKSHDLSFAAGVREELGRAISGAFLLGSSVQRNAERVTAAEFRLLYQELETSLAGNFAVLRREHHLPLVEHTLRRLTSARKIERLPPEVKISVVTGIEALGRGQDFERLVALADVLARVIGPERLGEFMHLDKFALRAGASLLVKNLSELVRSPEEIQQREQNTQTQSLIEQLGPEAIRSGAAAAATPPV